jgi:hypothetical protein
MSALLYRAAKRQRLAQAALGKASQHSPQAQDPAVNGLAGGDARDTRAACQCSVAGGVS